MATDTALEDWTLRKTLEHHRLALRARRLEQVVAALEERAVSHAADGAVPLPLTYAIRDFRHELRDVRAQLADVGGGLDDIRAAAS